MLLELTNFKNFCLRVIRMDQIIQQRCVASEGHSRNARLNGHGVTPVQFNLVNSLLDCFQISQFNAIIESTTVPYHSSRLYQALIVG